MKINKYILLIVFFSIPMFGFSQLWKLSRSEYMYGVGVSNYFGDIGGAKSSSGSGFADIDFLNTRPALSVGYRYKVFDRIAVKANLTYANMHGSDASSLNENRNYTFTTNMVELNGHVEYHFTEEKQMVSYSSMSMRGRLKKINAGLNIYIFVGVGGAYFKPKALDALSGNDRYVGNKNIALVVPYGIGLKYPLTSKSYVGIEFGRRFITSDYIDGFNPEQSKYRDLYYFTVISVSYKMERRNKRIQEFRF